MPLFEAGKLACRVQRVKEYQVCYTAPEKPLISNVKFSDL
jgi:hypothetical protein